MPHLLFLLLSAAPSVVTGPAVFQATDPVGPGQTVVVVGEGLASPARAEVARLADGEPGEPPFSNDPPGWSKGLSPVPAEVPQAGPQCVKFIVPPSLLPGL